MMSAMFYFFLLVVFFICNVVCEDCMTFNFENGLEDFNNNSICDKGQDMWHLGNYSRMSMDGFHPKSSVFATPSISWSCMSSPMFQMQAGGTLEINLYLKPNVALNQVSFFVCRYVEGGNDVTVGTGSPIPREGWQSINITVSGFRSFLGYILFTGVATRPSNEVYVDSLRYIPPSMMEEECQIYKDVEVIDPEEDKKPRYSIFFMIKMGILKILN